MNKARKYLSATGLLEIASKVFGKIKLQIKRKSKESITTKDCLMSALAMFGLKYASLLKFDKDSREERIIDNLKALYKIEKVPSDTYMRERLDEINPSDINKAFKSTFAAFQRGKGLEAFKFINGSYLFSIDATGFFSSNNVFCDNCCVKETNSKKLYHHQMLCGAIVHPNMKTVIPFAPEPIIKKDGDTKNDCEANAIKRFIKNFRKEHPHLKVIVVTDGFHSKGPTVMLLKEHGISFILGAKPGDHKYLFECVKGVCLEYTNVTRDNKIQKFRYLNNVSLNDSNNNVIINFLELTEINQKTKKETTFSWVTDIKISKHNITLIAQGGRARWKIENEVFNTLKNQNYSFEHNYGHGQKNLSTVFAMLLMLAFLIDQIQEICDYMFQQALLKSQRKKYLWERLRGLFFDFNLTSWEQLWQAIAYGFESTLTIKSSA